MELIAHRGCGDPYPENTVAAVRRAAERLPAVEVDVRRCGSGELVCVHDATVDRITDGTGRVSELALAELDRLAVQGSDERIPTLAAVVDALPQTVTLQVELKEPGLGDDVVRTLGSRSDVRLSSFEPAALREVRAAEIPTGFLFRGEPRENLALAESLACTNVHPHWQDCATSSIVERARDRGFGVYAWGIESDPDALAAAARAGVDGATVDRPDLAAERDGSGPSGP